jgi:hypothetical protein
VTADTRLHALGSSYSPTGDTGSMYDVTQMTGAQEYWKAGYTATVVQLGAFFSDDHVHMALLVEGQKLVGTIERADLTPRLSAETSVDDREARGKNHQPDARVRSRLAGCAAASAAPAHWSRSAGARTLRSPLMRRSQARQGSEDRP